MGEDRDRAADDTDPGDAADGTGAGDADRGSADGYVHRPEGDPAVDDDANRFGWRGWVLVATLVVAFLVVPLALLAVPHVQSTIARFGLTRRYAYLVLPLVPALVLGAVAVWSALGSAPE